MFKTKTIPDEIETETVDCDLCGSDNLEVWDRARSNTLTRCLECGLVFTNPRIKDPAAKESLFYDENYFSQDSRWVTRQIEARRKSYDLEIRALEHHVPGGRFLDVGCGMGTFLDCFADQWDKHGCDISAYGLKEAADRGITVYHGQFEKLDFAELRFDVIYFRASLHHAYAPSQCLRRAHELLGEGGILAIAMSNNNDGLCGKLFRGHVRSYEQAHNFLFSTETLRRYLKDNGFEVIQSHCPYFGTGYPSLSDFLSLPFIYGGYLALKLIGKSNAETRYDISSPPFYGNYVNLYARKCDYIG